MELQCNLVYVVLGVVLTTLILYVKKVQSYWKNSNVPTPDFYFLLGHSLPRIQKKVTPWQQFDGYYKQFKKSSKMVGLYFFTKPAVVLLDLDLIKQVMITDYDVFNSRGSYVNEKNDPISAHLFALGGQKWRRLRNKLSPTFTSGKMKMMFSTMVSVSEAFKKSVETIVKDNPEGFKIKNVTSRFTTDVIGNCAFGIECNSLVDPNNKFREMGDRVFRRNRLRSLYMHFISTFPKLSLRLGLSMTRKDVSEFFTKTVVDNVKYREDNDVKRNDFMDLLIKMKNQGAQEDRLTINEIVSQSFIFFIAGFETSSSTMMFCLYELALRPDIQDKARENIMTVLAKHGGELTYESLQEMDYLDKVVNETLRKYPPVPTLSRRAAQDYRVPNTDVVIPEGTIVLIPAISIQMDPEVYPDPEIFDPHRFDKEETSKRHTCAFLPFGEGPRICIGLRFGMMQAKIGLVSLLTAFKFSPSAKTDIPLVMDKSSVILMAQDDIHLKVDSIL